MRNKSVGSTISWSNRLANGDERFGDSLQTMEALVKFKTIY